MFGSTLQEQPDFPHTIDTTQSKVYLFTTWATMDKADFLAAVRAAYRAVCPESGPNHLGPTNAVVAREFGQARPCRPHLHLAAEFENRHRWRAVRDELRRTHHIEFACEKSSHRQG